MTFGAFVIYSIVCFIFSSVNRKTIFVILISIGLILFSGLRFESGVDYFSYLNLYESAYIQSSEFLYWMLSIIHQNVFNSFSSYVFLISFLVLIIKVYVLNRLSDNVYISVYIFICISFIYVDMGFIRSSLALALFMLSFLFLVHGSKRYACLIFIFSIFFHHSVLFMSFSFFICGRSDVNKRINYIYLLIGIFLLSFVGLFESVILFIVEILPLPHTFSWKIFYYLNNYSYDGSVLNFYIFRFLVVTILLLCHRNVQYNPIVLKNYLIGVCLMVAFGFNIQFYTRIGLFTAFFEMLLISTLSCYYKGRVRPLFIYCLMIFYGAIFVRTAYVMNIHSVGFL